MKYIILLILSLFALSCTEMWYAYDYAKLSSAESQKVYEEILESKYEGQALNVYRFELFNCEVSINGIFSRVLEVPENCEGKIFGRHHLDILELANNQLLFISAEKNKEGNKIIGPTLIYKGKYQENGEELKDLIQLEEKFVVNMKRGKSEFRTKGERVNISLSYKRINAESLLIDQVVVRDKTAIGGDKPQVFNLKSLIARDPVFVLQQ